MMNGEGRVWRLDTVMAEVQAVRIENGRLLDEARELDGRLREARRANKALRREWARAEAKARRTADYYRELLVAVAGLSAAVMCLICVLAIVGGGR